MAYQSPFRTALAAARRGALRVMHDPVLNDPTVPDGHKAIHRHRVVNSPLYQRDADSKLPISTQVLREAQAESGDDEVLMHGRSY